MLVPLSEAVPQTCGGKAGSLGRLLRSGMRVPDGFVVPFAVYHAVVGELPQDGLAGRGPAATLGAIHSRPLPVPVTEAMEHALQELGDPPVAVRSSATNEDTSGSSAAGQYESTLAVQGATAVSSAVRACWSSLFSARATAYQSRSDDGQGELATPQMAVIVQRHLDAEVSGVLFTQDDHGDATVIEAAWGLGPSVVAGGVTPDTYRVGSDGKVTVELGEKRKRLDRVGTRVVAQDVPVGCRQRATLDEATARELSLLGARVAATMGCPQDIEWALAEGQVWLLQARPITVALPSVPPFTPSNSLTLPGTPGSRGISTGTARTVRGPHDFARVRPGDILVCPFTDPAWTPLLRMAAGVVTETGGALSHAAIVAREYGIPAVLGVANAMTTIIDGATITIDGTAGTIRTSPA